MTRILIPTYVSDVHAISVHLAMQRKGHESVLWYGSDFPSRQTSSIALSPETGLSWEISGPDMELLDEPFDVVWYRRPTEPEVPDDLHPADRYIAKRACMAHYRALWEVMARDAFWVNHHHRRVPASVKPWQLEVARRAGLAIPPTLCSNDPARIRSFLREHAGHTVYKPFYSAQWRTEEGTALVFTTPLGLDDLPDDEMLQVSSGIWQRKVDKDHELRVIWMGGHTVVGKLLSQDHPDAEMDWKAAFRELGVAPGDPLPPEVHAGCRRLMDELGLAFGCIDLIVTPDGDHVFLEVNEMGQFLFVEEYNPSIPVLDTFCEFLLHGQLPWDGHCPGPPVRFADLREEILSFMDRAKEVHVPRVFRQAADDTGKSADGVARISGPV